MNGQEIQPEDPNEYAYKLDVTKIKTFDEIKKVENMRLFHEQTFGSPESKAWTNSSRPKSFSISGVQPGFPTLVDTRPWIYRTAVGEIPNCLGLSFLDLFEKDSKSGA
jgi:hypothetical protein